LVLLGKREGNEKKDAPFSDPTKKEGLLPTKGLLNGGCCFAPKGVKNIETGPRSKKKEDRGKGLLSIGRKGSPRRITL